MSNLFIEIEGHYYRKSIFQHFATYRVDRVWTGETFIDGTTYQVIGETENGVDIEVAAGFSDKAKADSWLKEFINNNYGT